jgi:hypothetical protein
MEITTTSQIMRAIPSSSAADWQIQRSPFGSPGLRLASYASMPVQSRTGGIRGVHMEINAGGSKGWNARFAIGASSDAWKRAVRPGGGVLVAPSRCLGRRYH